MQKQRNYRKILLQCELNIQMNILRKIQGNSKLSAFRQTAMSLTRIYTITPFQKSWRITTYRYKNKNPKVSPTMVSFGFLFFGGDGESRTRVQNHLAKGSTSVVCHLSFPQPAAANSLRSTVSPIT